MHIFTGKVPGLIFLPKFVLLTINNNSIVTFFHVKLNFISSKMPACQISRVLYCKLKCLEILSSALARKTSKTSLQYQFAFSSLVFDLTINQEMAAAPSEFIYMAMKLQCIKNQTNMEHMQIISMKS